MKKSDLKSATAVNMKESLTKLNVDSLKNTGKPFGGISFWIGDVLTFPDWGDMEIFQDSFEDKDGVSHPFPVVKVSLNDRCRVIPVGSFRRHMAGLPEYIEKFGSIDSLHREIVLSQSDFELMQLFAGKTVKVRDKFDARTVKFDGKNRVAYNQDDNKTYNTAKWPIFEVVNND